MVNGIEREMLQSEWENWLADENGRCEQARVMVLEGGGRGAEEVEDKPGLMQKVLGGKSKKQGGVDRAALRRWYDEYCGSCEADRIALVREAGSLVM